MIWLIFAHYLGDFGLQKEWIALNKGKYWYLMLAHSVIWTACICYTLDRYIKNVLVWHVVFLLVGHFLCDTWKCKSTRDFPTWHFYVDQVWHIIQCVVVCYV